MSNTILEGIRVLDLANENGVYCTRLLAELGAEVIKVEPPKGDSTRHIGPFAGDEKDIEKSLFHAYYNAGKKSITLDIQKEEGRALFLKLVRDADVLVETSKPGTMRELGLDYETLKKEYPQLIMCSITPFGQEGPHAQWQASSDLIPYAMGGPMYETGIPGREPLQVGLNFTANMVSVLALTGIVSLISARAADGMGDYLDMSMFSAAATWRGEVPGVYQYYHKVTSRTGSQGMFVPYNYYACKDGYVQLLGSGKWDEFIQWMKEDGLDVGHFDDPKYGGPSYFNQNLVAEREEVNALVSRHTALHNKQSYMEEAQRRNIPVGASETPQSVLESPHYKERGLFVEVDNPEIGRYKTVANPIKFSKAELKVGGKPPVLGEHNAEIYGRLGLSAQEISTLKEQSVI
ncbi:MAG: CaiB/BaiF CoA transferase family protein [Coprococcus sp.]